MNRVIGLIVISLMAVPAMAALSPQHVEWGAGPAQWIMTSDEKRAWRKVTTDSDAVNFIDLFWVRRDPSPGTAINEYRNEYEARVAFADEAYGEKYKRGAMTDRGRVFIVLDAATKVGAQLRESDPKKDLPHRQGNNKIAMSVDAGRQRGARDIWIWDHADAQKFGMPKVEVVFVEDPITRRYQRDPGRPDFSLAGAVAIRNAIVNPDLTAVPAWAPTGGLRPVAPLTIAEAVPAIPSVPPDITASDEPADPSDSDMEIFGPPVASSSPGLSRLTLLRGKWIESRSSTDPFAGHAETTFMNGDDVRWAVQFCAARADVPKLKTGLFIVGPLDGVSKEQGTKQEDARPEWIAATPGCYVLQGSVPKLAAGRYELSVLIDEPARGEIYDIKRELRVE